MPTQMTPSDRVQSAALLVVKDQLHKLREAGQKEYAHDTANAFGNFERVGDKLGLDRCEVLAVYAHKHLDGITAFFNGHRSQREPITGRLNDLVVYAALLHGMVTGAKTRADMAGVLDALLQNPKLEKANDANTLLGFVTGHFDHCAEQIKFGLAKEDTQTLFELVLSLRVLVEAIDVCTAMGFVK